MLNLKVKFRESSVRLPIPRIGRTEHRYNFVGKEASYSRRSALHIPKERPEPRHSFTKTVWAMFAGPTALSLDDKNIRARSAVYRAVRYRGKFLLPEVEPSGLFPA